MGKADLHAHSCHDAWGDGNQTVEELFRFVEEETDLDVFAITDHDSTDAARAAWDLHRLGPAGGRRSSYRFDFLPGVEVTNQSGHLLCYFPGGNIVDIPSLRPFWWTVRFAHRHGAICVAAHPIYPPWLPSVIERGLAAGERLEGLEAINAGLSESAQRKLDTVAERLRAGPHDWSGAAGDFEATCRQVALVGNSDAHHAAALGAAYTAFPGSTLGDYLQALQECRTEPVFVRRPQLEGHARRFTTRRSMTRPGWVRNLWREIRASLGPGVPSSPR
jgi:predicted metal-dependent phosphoesterase TrpH